MFRVVLFRSGCRWLIDVFFFFQAEDGIRDHCVTGVQTCALPIWVPGTRQPAPGTRMRPRMSLVTACVQGARGGTSWASRCARTSGSIGDDGDGTGVGVGGVGGGTMMPTSASMIAAGSARSVFATIAMD